MLGDPLGAHPLVSPSRRFRDGGRDDYRRLGDKFNYSESVCCPYGQGDGGTPQQGPSLRPINGDLSPISDLVPTTI